ncbi:hypothetical protein B0H14DRAFT_1294908 [Mycena olivaceomarginata]|nr:hypothetical protein B0H14DRAFT_1294908 [Mycena olivaceomarginata]
MQESGIQSVISAPSHTATHSALTPLKVSSSVAHTFKMRRSRQRPRPSCTSVTRQTRMSIDGPSSLELSAPPNRRSYSRGLCFSIMGIGDGVSEGAKGSADSPSLLNLFDPPIDGLDACTHEGCVPPWARRLHLQPIPAFCFSTGICSPPRRPLDYHMMDDNTTSPLFGAQSAFTTCLCVAHSTPVCCSPHRVRVHAARASGGARIPPRTPQTRRIPRTGGRLLRLVAPAFVANDAPNVRNHIHGALLPRRRLFITVMSESTTCFGGRCGRAVTSWPPCAVILQRLPDGCATPSFRGLRPIYHRSLPGARLKQAEVSLDQAHASNLPRPMHFGHEG